MSTNTNTENFDNKVKRFLEIAKTDGILDIETDETFNDAFNTFKTILTNAGFNNSFSSPPKARLLMSKNDNDTKNTKVKKTKSTKAYKLSGYNIFSKVSSLVYNENKLAFNLSMTSKLWKELSESDKLVFNNFATDIDGELDLSNADTLKSLIPLNLKCEFEETYTWFLKIQKAMKSANINFEKLIWKNMTIDERTEWFANNKQYLNL